MKTQAPGSEAYYGYFDKTVSDYKCFALMDVGISRTIQYFMSKLLGQKIEAYNLSTWI